MPLYEYECDCGKKFERILAIAKMDSVECVCGKTPRRLMSKWGRVLVAGLFKVVDSDGNILNQYQTTERTPYEYQTESGVKTL